MLLKKEKEKEVSSLADMEPSGKKAMKREHP